MSERESFTIPDVIVGIEKVILVLIVLLTVGAVLIELNTVWTNRTIQIADILLLFLYTEVISMVGIFYRSQTIPVVYPIFIAITALSRLVVLQSKDMDPQAILFEASAILILGLAAIALRFTITEQFKEATAPQPRKR
ncbi:MAG: phosphate-starvation-inducible PsiE family protein [Pseudomonadota bacterium]